MPQSLNAPSIGDAMTVPDSAFVHPTAIVEDGATLGEGVFVGPYCLVGPKVRLADGVRLDAHVCLAGDTSVGERTRIYPFASIGSDPQDLKFRGEETRLVIGSDVIIREHVTMNPGTEGGGGLTQIGDRCLFMVGAHVAHDCKIGSNAIFANNATLAGHVETGDFVVLGGFSAVHQFVRIGSHAMIGGMTGVPADVIPAGTVIGNRGYLAGLNLTGLKRRGFPKEEIHQLRGAYREIFSGQEGEQRDRAARVAGTVGDTGIAREMIDFLLSDSNRRFCQPQD